MGEATSTVEVGMDVWVSAGVAVFVEGDGVGLEQEETKKRSENIYREDFFTIIAR
jgi:hypothetical protein